MGPKLVRRVLTFPESSVMRKLVMTEMTGQNITGIHVARLRHETPVPE